MSSKTVTIEIREGIDGQNKIFSTPEEYLANTVIASIKEADGTFYISCTVEELGGSFFALDTAPAGDQYVEVTYDIEFNNIAIPTTPVTSSVTTSLDPIDIKNLSSLVDLVYQQSKLIAAMDVALKERVSRKEFDKWASSIEAKINEINNSVTLIKAGK